MPSDTRKKTYTPPKLNKLTQEQANLILLGHCCDQGAKDLLDVLYPLDKSDGSADGPAYCEQQEPAESTPKVSWLLHRALTAFRSTREDVRRFVRG